MSRSGASGPESENLHVRISNTLLWMWLHALPKSYGGSYAKVKVVIYECLVNGLAIVHAVDDALADKE